MTDAVLVLVYAATGAMSLRASLRWMRADFATVAAIDNEDRIFLGWYGLLFGALLWPLGLPAIWLMTYGTRRKGRRTGLLIRVGSWGEK